MHIYSEDDQSIQSINTKTVESTETSESIEMSETIDSTESIEACNNFITSDIVIVLITTFLGTFIGGATVFLLELLRRKRKESEEQLYSINFLIEYICTIFQSSLILQKQTFNSHLEYIDQFNMVVNSTGNIQNTIEKMLSDYLDNDEWFVLNNNSIPLQVPKEYLIIIGRYDSKLSFNWEIVKNNNLEIQYKADLLNKYVEDVFKQKIFPTEAFGKYYKIKLENTSHANIKIIWFIYYVINPQLKLFIKNKLRASKKKIQNYKIDELADSYKDIIPEYDYLIKRFGND